MGPVVALGVVAVLLVLHLGLEWVWARRKVRERSQVVGPVGRDRLP